MPGWPDARQRRAPTGAAYARLSVRTGGRCTVVGCIKHRSPRDGSAGGWKALSNLELRPTSACAFCPALSKAYVETRTRWSRRHASILCLYLQHTWEFATDRLEIFFFRGPTIFDIFTATRDERTNLGRRHREFRSQSVLNSTSGRHGCRRIFRRCCSHRTGLERSVISTSGWQHARKSPRSHEHRLSHSSAAVVSSGTGAAIRWAV